MCALDRSAVCVIRDKNSSSNMKIDTLSFLNTLLIHHSPSVFHPHMRVLVPVSQNISPPHAGPCAGESECLTPTRGSLFG